MLKFNLSNSSLIFGSSGTAIASGNNDQKASALAYNQNEDKVSYNTTNIV